jgi:predicted CoA-binding protein
MIAIADAAEEFLTARRIAVTGVSRTAKGHGGNVVLQGLRARGFDVVPVNPNADEVEGTTCYHSLSDIPGTVDAVVIATSPDKAEATVRECERLGVRQVWLHRSLGAGSVSDAAVDYGRSHGMRIIPGGCPLMFGADADRGHRFMRGFCRMTGAVPRQI